jgi:RNA polymerase sigma factor for flagellar operon FliA
MISVSDSFSAVVTCVSPVSPADYLDIVETVVARVGKRLPFHVSREDLASVGRLALVKALRVARGTETEIRAQCFVRVRGAVLDELRSSDVLSRHDRALYRAMLELRRQHLQATAEELPLELVAVRLECTLARLERIQALLASDQEDIDLTQVADAGCISPDMAAMSAEVIGSIRSLLATLPRMQAHAVVRAHLEDATLAEIAAELGVSIERARQLRVAGEKALRQAIVKAWKLDNLD